MVVYLIRFRGFSQTLKGSYLTAIRGTTNLLLISKSVFIICAYLGANFPHHITIQRLVAFIFHVDLATRVGRDSSVGIATRYGLFDSGIESRWGRDFPHPSRTAQGTTQPPVQWVPGLSRG